MTDRKTASTITDTELDQLYDQLAALRTVARGYCPTCGRGDAAPTVEDWERERQRADNLADEITALRDDLHGITGARWIADMLDTILNGDEPTPGPAAAKPPACRYCPDPLCPENCPECGVDVHDLDAVPPAAGPAATEATAPVDTAHRYCILCGGQSQPGHTCDPASLRRVYGSLVDRAERDHGRAEQLAATLREILNMFTTARRDNGVIAGHFLEGSIHPDDMNRWHVALEPAKEQH